MSSFEAVESEISAVKAKIEAVEVQIDEAKKRTEEAEEAGDKAGLQRWSQREEQLRVKENKLLEKENMLRAEKVRLETAGSGEDVFQKVTLLWSTYSNEVSRRVLKGYSRESLVSLVRSMGGQTLLSVDELPLGWEKWKEERLMDEVEIQLRPLEQVEVEEGGTYLLVYLVTNLTEQLKALARWQESVVDGFEGSAAERAVQALRDAGHDDVSRFCLAKKVRKPGQPGVQVEIDAAAVASNCGLVVECKAVVDSAAAQQLKGALSKISTLAEEGVEAVQPFRGKRLMGALCGLRITPNASNRKRLEQLCAENDFEIWLPNGTDLGVGDGCFDSPCVFTPAPHELAVAHPRSPRAVMPRPTMPQRCAPPNANSQLTRWKARSLWPKPVVGTPSRMRVPNTTGGALPCRLGNMQGRLGAACF